MEICLKKELVTNALGELRYLGADFGYHYDEKTKKRTEQVTSLTVHLGCARLGNSIDVRIKSMELPKITPYSFVELDGLIYRPYAVKVGERGELKEYFECNNIRPMLNKTA